MEIRREQKTGDVGENMIASSPHYEAVEEGMQRGQRQARRVNRPAREGGGENGECQQGKVLECKRGCGCSLPSLPWS